MPKQPTAIEGILQSYAWGGTQFLAEFLQQPNPSQGPQAELWLGAHPKGPAKVVGSETTLDVLIDENPQQMLGPTVAARFSATLPFLFKVLDVREMLSIQIHPTKAAAEAGFAREEAAGIPRTADHRNYRDPNHKPELGVALTDFYLLHGFRNPDEIRQTLQSVPGWQALEPYLRRGIPELYRYVMEAGQDRVDELLHPLAGQLRNTSGHDRSTPAFWARRALEQYTREGHYDRGIFSIYWFNIVHLRPGEGIFQDAGIPHAYLAGSCLELMANSDNVLRGGLTPKHIDVPELLAHIDCSAVTPQILQPAPGPGDWKHYPTPAPDFSLSLQDATAGDRVTADCPLGPAILLLLDGQVKHEASGLQLHTRQRAAFLPAGESYSFEVTADCRVYLAAVGEMPRLPKQ
ncbi:mannose-6-phosphate isomerase, class I [Neolewinella lacunae]|uniref:mannose-6-phosphate isomerase n=1 Tax=Neolewinella lacunae TaxID=1517758 RepID=A0A923PIT1_9BACT|nr:mannose-6-phosphate isomerase, class I [Neolewinella lacunae]MBC6993471.1 mannose-6-phosphate isomerase, class I [Neolewinella lacunae]MDN3636253.1 mannose-6-phosphate isomerase, class I [Neolewinella lacunae]